MPAPEPSYADLANCTDLAGLLGTYETTLGVLKDNLNKLYTALDEEVDLPYSSLQSAVLDGLENLRPKYDTLECIHNILVIKEDNVTLRKQRRAALVTLVEDRNETFRRIHALVNSKRRSAEANAKDEARTYQENQQSLDATNYNTELRARLRPKELTREHTMAEYTEWKKTLNAWANAMQLETWAEPDQVETTLTFLHYDLKAEVRSKFTVSKTSDNIGDLTVADLIAALDEIFERLHPLYTRRVNLFSMKRKDAETGSQFLARTLNAAKQADLKLLKEDDIISLILHMGIRVPKLSDKWASKTAVSLDKIKNSIAEYDRCQAASTAPALPLLSLLLHLLLLVGLLSRVILAVNLHALLARWSVFDVALPTTLRRALRTETNSTVDFAR